MPLLELGLIVAMATGQCSQTPALKYPTKIEQTGDYMNGAWDTGIAIVAGQPTEKTIRALKDKGFTLVVNFRTASEMANRQYVPFDEEALLKELGIKYVHLPMSGDSGSNPDGPHIVEGLAEALKGHEGKALVHCTVAWRASYVWTSYLHRYRGLDLSEAVRHGQEMEVSSFLERLLGTKIVYTPEKKFGGGEGMPRPVTTPSGASSQWTSIIDGAKAAELRQLGATLLDVRANYMEYIDGHLEGAVHLDANSLRGPKDGLPVQYRSPAEMAETLRLAGVSKGKPVVLYASPADVLNTTMTAYVLQKLGAGKTYVVDGGSAEAPAAGGIQKLIPTVSAGDFASRSTAPISASIDDVRQALQSGSVTFVDARPPVQYSGEQKLWVRNGHIPGAINVFWKTLTRDENAHAFRPKEEIAKIFSGKGIQPEQDVIVYCGTSKEATLIWLVLSRELGFKKVRVFEGAWTEYATRTELPLVTGTNPR